MKYAVIDMGSNTIRLCVYQISGADFHLLFSEKAMTGLAGYVRDGALTREGIGRACDTLLGFRDLLAQFSIDRTFVFATASLRNITNTEEAIHAIQTRTGFPIDLISGRDEALLDFRGSLRSVNLKSGVLLDTGGGSTELLVFDGVTPLLARSIPIGSLNLHKAYVRKFLPNPTEQEAIRKRILTEWKSLRENLDQDARKAEHEVKTALRRIPEEPDICGVGGTARAALKLINASFDLHPENREFTARQLHTLTEELCTRNRDARTQILRICPDRVHTILPGLLILDTLIGKLGGKHITISPYGVREGYLCRQIQRQTENPSNTTFPIPEAGN